MYMVAYKQQEFIAHRSGGSTSEIRSQHGQLRASAWVADSLLCPHMAEGAWELCEISSKGTHPIRKDSTLMT